MTARVLPQAVVDPVDADDVAATTEVVRSWACR